MLRRVSYQVFARKYRPQTFADVVGQEHITRTLENAIAGNRLAHAYLFVGPRGVGKTSTARILAKALNCVNGPTVTPCGVCEPCKEIAQGNSLDVLEIDGASNNGVEQVRELRDNVRFAPTRGKYKIYIIDEVHMLTTAAFNALLKTLEEPPEHVKFIFATTEPQKVLPTILSRCQRFDLRRIPTQLIARHLEFIAKNENVTIDECSAEAIARGADGGLRDAESMLDQLVAFCGDTITEADVLSVFGFTAQKTIEDLAAAILGRDTPNALRIVHEQSEAGKDLGRLMAELISHFRHLLVAKSDPQGVKEELGGCSLDVIRQQATLAPADRLLDLLDQFATAETRMKWAPNKRLHFEVAVIKAIQTLTQVTLTEVIDTLATLRDGQIPPARPTAPPAARVEPAKAPRPAERRMETARTAEQPPSKPRETSPVAREIPSPVTTTEPAPSAVDKPAEAPESASTEPVDIDSVWIALVQQVRSKRPLITAWIESGRLVQLGNGRATIAFPPNQKISMESVARPGNRKFLEELLSEIVGTPTTFTCELRSGVEPLTLPEVSVEPARGPASSAVEDFKNDPLIKKALEIFKAEMEPT
jgi:DNA polymerase-3 subunit gamma/tau